MAAVPPKFASRHACSKHEAMSRMLYIYLPCRQQKLAAGRDKDFAETRLQPQQQQQQE
jgi:hypothetical protein